MPCGSFMLSDPAGELRRRWNTTFAAVPRRERSTPTIDSDLEVSKAKCYPMLLGRFWAWFWVALVYVFGVLRERKQADEDLNSAKNQAKQIVNDAYKSAGK